MALKELSLREKHSYRRKGHLARAWSRLIRKKLAVASIAALIIIYTAGIFAPLLSRYPYSEPHFDAIRQAPSLQYWAGTDRAGRDMFTRVQWGIQNTIILTVVGMLTGGLVIGVTLGLISGYLGRWPDTLIMRTGELFTVIPTFFLVLVIAVTLRSRVREWVIWIEDTSFPVGDIIILLAISIFVLFAAAKLVRKPILQPKPNLIIISLSLAIAIGLGITKFTLGSIYVSPDGLISSGVVDYLVISVALVVFGWFSTARLVRGQVLYLKETQHVEAARAIGASTTRILFRHLLPNAISPLVVTVTMGMGSMVGVEIFLSWVGIGIQPPRPSLGLMLWESGHISVLRNEPWMLLAPGIATWLMIFSWTLLGDALNDVLNPRTR